MLVTVTVVLLVVFVAAVAVTVARRGEGWQGAPVLLRANEKQRFQARRGR